MTLCSIIFSLCFLMIACRPLGPSGDREKEMADYKSMEKTIDTVYPVLSLEELSDYSDLIVSAKFKAYDDPFPVTPHGGGEPFIFKDANFEIVEVFKGDAEVNDQIVVRIQGGQVVDHAKKMIYRDFVSDTFTFNEEGVNLLFLARPTADRYKTREDYYKLVAGPNSIYSDVSGVFKNVDDESRTIKREELEAIDPSVDPKATQKAQMDKNLKDGTVTEEEYDTYFEQWEQYGTRE